jgi:hypothetical protein
VAGFATLQLDDPAADPNESADVTLDELTDLGFFAIQLEALSDADDILSGQTIRFTTVEQADGREVRVVDLIDNNAPGIDTVNSTNVVWLFENLNGGDPIDTSGYFEPGPAASGGYQIGRLWIIEELITNEGGNIEDLFTTLPPAIIRAEFSDAALLDALLSAQPVNRIFEVVSFLELGNISFNDTGIDPDEFIETLTVKLGGQSTIGDITLDDEIAPNTDPDSIAFNELTIESHRSLSDDYFLATEFYDNDNNGVVVAGEDVLPDNINTIGDIGTGAGLELEIVNIDTLNDSVALEGTGSVVGMSPGAELEVGTITYDSNDAGTVVELNVEGENDVTIASVDTTDTDILAIATANNLTGGATLIAPGASPAFNLDNTEGWTLTGGGNMVAGSATNAGVVGDELSLIDADTSTGNLDFGVVADIDGSDDEEEDFNGDGDEGDAFEDANIAFAFNSGTGVTNMTLGTANGRTPTLEAGSTWQFDLADADPEGSSLTITDDVIFQPSPPLPADPTTLRMIGVPVIIDGTVDFTQITLDFDSATTVWVPAGNTLVLTVDQVLELAGIGVHIFGEGTTEIIGDGTDTDLVGDAFRQFVDTVNIDASAVTLDTTPPAPDDADDTFIINVGFAVNDDGDLVGHNVTGTANDDAIDLGLGDDTVTGGAGDDQLLGRAGADTFIVDAGTDSIADLGGAFDPGPNDPDADVLIVLAGATADAQVQENFVATSETTNAGTANLSRTTSTADGSIDVSAAGGPNGYNLTGSSDNALSVDYLTGSAQDDVINGGNSAQSAAAAIDILTGGGGEDTFQFNISLGGGLIFSIENTTDGVDQEVLDIDDVAAVDDNDEELVITLTINGIPFVRTINDTTNGSNVDFGSSASVANAVVASINALGLATISASANGDNDVVITGDPGVNVTLAVTSFTGTNAGLTVVSVDGTDEAQVTEVTVSGAATVGDEYTLTINYQEPASGQSAIITSVATDPASNAAALEAAITDDAEITPSVAGAVITITDDIDDNGGFTVTPSFVASFAGSGASNDPDQAFASVFADVITDFDEAEDVVEFVNTGDGAEMEDGSNSNYDEDAGHDTYALALAEAIAEFTANSGDLQYYLTSADDFDGVGGTGTVEGQEGGGLLFFDANLDGSVDGVITLLGVDSSSFDDSNITAITV